MILGKLLAGRYQIVEILSSEEFYQTYLAQDLDQPSHTNCIVKHLSTATSLQPQVLASLRHLFTREAQALEKLGDYNRIPQLLAYFEAEAEFYLVQQFIPGHPLSAELQPNQPWHERQVIDLLQEVLGILEYVHHCGLIHRDLKPSNLIRRQTDQRLVLTDFGSVKQAWMQVVTTHGETRSQFVEGTPATIAVGTPGYMPSEQGRGRPRPNSDVYALGMIAIQALTGCSPEQLWEDPETGEVLWQQSADVSPHLAAVISQMVRYHYKDRYQSAAEVRQALQSSRSYTSIADTDLVSSPAVPDERSPNANISDNRLALIIGVTLGVTAAIALMIAGYFSLQAPKPTPEDPTEQSTQPQSSPTLANLTVANTLIGHDSSVWSVAVTPDNQTLVSGSEDRTIKIWDLATGQIRRTLSGHTDTVRSIALSPDGQTVISGGGDGTIRLWNLATGTLLRTIPARSGPIWTVAVSRDNQNLISGNGDGTIKIWNPQTGELRQTLKGHSGRVFAIALSPNGQTLASGSIDKTIKVWNYQTGQLLRTIDPAADSVRAIAISPDGRTLASGNWDQTVALWDIQTGAQLYQFKGHTARVVSTNFSPDGETLISAGIDKNIKMWDVPTKTLLRSLTAHSDWILAVIFTPSGESLVSSSKDGTIKIWQP